MNATAFGESGQDTETTRLTRPRESLPPEERGRLTVDDRVVEKVAGHAVTLIADASAAPRRLLGVTVGGARPDDAASVQAEVQGDIASVRVIIAVRWPQPVQKVADEVRKRIRSELSTSTGVHVDHVDVEVVAMTLPDTSRRVI